MPRPNFIIAGPPKTGTTSLFDWLHQHPEACGSKVKETYYFYESAGKDSPYPNFNKDGWGKYEGLFKKCDGHKIIFEASPGYLHSSLAADKLGSLPGIKVVAIYRNAADRLFSEYQFNRYKTKKIKGSFSDYLGYDGRDFHGQKFAECSMIPFVGQWINKVPEDHFKIIRFKEIKENPRILMQKLSVFLGIDDSFFETLDFQKKNETFGVKNAGLHRWATRVKEKVPGFMLEALTPIYFSINKKSIPAISQEEKDLKEKLSQKIAAEEALFQTQFAHLFL